jgi:hypothetical protein
MSSRQPIRVSLSGDRSGEYVVTVEHPDGSLVLRPEDSGRPTRRHPRPRHGALGALLSGRLASNSGDGSQTVPEMLEEWGVGLHGDEQVREFLHLEVNGIAGFAAITTARMIFAPHHVRGPGSADEFALATLENVELSLRRGRHRLRATWASGKTTIQGSRDALDRLRQALVG